MLGWSTLVGTDPDRTGSRSGWRAWRHLSTCGGRDEARKKIELGSLPLLRVGLTLLLAWILVRGECGHADRFIAADSLSS